MADLTMDQVTRMRELLTRFKLPTVAAEIIKRLTDAGHTDALGTLLEVFEAEADERGQRRTERLLRASRLPADKTFETLERGRLPRPVLAKLDELATGEFLERADNVLCFGLPGRGKTHAAVALGHALVQRGHPVLFTPTFRLVQELLAAKRDLALPRALQKLDAFELLILDDIGYVQQSADEVEVLRPILDELRAWIDRQKAVIPPKTPLGKGLGYLDRQWPRLLLFLEDGNIEATNNRRERELRRLILGRKNWLFTWLDEGGTRTGDILSIIATCIAHDVNPRAYLHRVVHCIVHGWPQAQIRDLLPDRMLAAHPELFVGDPDALPIPATTRALSR
jgi:DNA replication protein DnaC